MLKRLLSAVIAVCASITAWAGPLEKTPVAIYDPLDHWELDFESGVLMRVGGNGSQLNYVELPQMLTIKSPEAFGWDLFGGRLAMRHRFALLLEPFAEGPEHFYFGVAGSGSLEWWNEPRSFSLFFSAGGGIGWMDSKGYEIEGAQGQDLNFNWFLYSGMRFRCCEHGSIALGLYYQHISNTGLDEINPGVDALGPMLSVGWHF